jgi:hypothetical protein
LVARRERVRKLLRVDVERLTPWARRRFGEGVGTVDLIRQAESQEDKEAVACVALLNLSDSALRACAGEDGALAEALLARRSELLRRLEAEGVTIEVPEEA